MESNHPQTRLRSHIFNNLIQVFPARSPFEITETEDLRLGEKARLQLENVIPELYQWFVEESVDSLLRDRIDCTRASEPPRKKKTAFEANLPVCRRGKNKSCRVEATIRERATDLIERLRPFFESSEQLARACGVFEHVLRNPSADLSHSDCRRAGDCLIALEATDHATHGLSTNVARVGAPLAGLGLSIR